MLLCCSGSTSHNALQSFKLAVMSVQSHGQLPANTRSSVSFSIFKTNAVLFLKSQFDSNLEANSTCTWFSSRSWTMCRCAWGEGEGGLFLVSRWDGLKR